MLSKDTNDNYKVGEHMALQGAGQVVSLILVIAALVIIGISALLLSKTGRK